MDALEAIMKRHGVLQYKSTPVEKEIIEKVLTAAIAAPSAANTQPWAFVVVTEKGLARRVAEYLLNTQEEYVLRKIIGIPEEFVGHLHKLFDQFFNVPCFIVICRQQRVKLAPPEYQDIMRDWDFMTLGGVMAQLMVAATALGLGTRWFGCPLPDNRGKTLKEMLGIPLDIEIAGVTPLGYHDEPQKKRPVQPLTTLTKFRRCDKYSLAALLNGKVALNDVMSYNKFAETVDKDDR